ALLRPVPTLVPYTTLFRSGVTLGQRLKHRVNTGGHARPVPVSAVDQYRPVMVQHDGLTQTVRFDVVDQFLELFALDQRESIGEGVNLVRAKLRHRYFFPCSSQWHGWHTAIMFSGT